MTMDLDERARRAGAGLRALADERAVSMRPPGANATTTGRRPRVLVGVAAAAIALVVAIVLVSDGGPAMLEIDPVGPSTAEQPVEPPPGPVADADGWLPVPEVGEVTAAYRADFTPVFVTHPVDGEVLVLDPIDPQRPFELDRLVAFCPSSGWFEDLYHGSRFNAWGDYTGGPAPTGLAAYPVEVDGDGTRVRIDGELQPAPAREERRGLEQGPIGPGCERDGEPTDIVGHRPPPTAPPLHGDEIPTEEWVWATLTLGGEPGDIRVCAPDGSCDADAPPVTFTFGQPGTQVERTPVTYLARLDDDGRVRVLHPADPTDGGYLQLTMREQALLSVPPPGTAAAVTLRDNTPVFAITTDDGDTHLLAAWSPDTPARLLGWCPTDQSLHGPTGRYAPDGSHLDGAGQDLATYGIAIDDVGDTRGIRITGRPAEADDAAAPAGDPGSTPTCSGELVTHQPTDTDAVFDSPDGIQLSGERWAWVRMSVQEREGERYLCSLAESVPACGVPHPEHTNCLGQDPDDLSTCPPLQDPVVTTPNVDPHDQRRLLLVRASDDGTTVAIRIPHGD